MDKELRAAIELCASVGADFWAFGPTNSGCGYYVWGVSGGEYLQIFRPTPKRRTGATVFPAEANSYGVWFR